MNLYQLRYFSVLAGTQHYGKAAEKLCIAQPSSVMPSPSWNRNWVYSFLNAKDVPAA